MWLADGLVSGQPGPVADDWFRSPSWTPEARRDFEQRLGRARRSGRPQYLRIKALALHAAGNDEGSEELLARIIAEYPEPASEVAFAYEKRGDLFRSRGLPSDAEASYRAAIAVVPSLSGTTGEVHLVLAEILLSRDGAAAGSEVESLLATARSNLKFNSTAFRWHVLRARLAAARGDLDARRSAAQEALAIVGADPQFSRHPTVGLARPTPELVAELEGFAGG
jgi:tetratricopeptide (TPR) repeat protein